jgi:hypothetical protein
MSFNTCEPSGGSIFLPILRVPSVPSVNFQNLPPWKKSSTIKSWHTLKCSRRKVHMYDTHTNKHTKKQKFETKRSNIANLNIHWLSWHQKYNKILTYILRSIFLEIPHLELPRWWKTPRDTNGKDECHI